MALLPLRNGGGHGGGGMLGGDCVGGESNSFSGLRFELEKVSEFLGDDKLLDVKESGE